MASRLENVGKNIAIGVVLAACALTAGAQPPFVFRDPPPPYRPAKDAKDLRSVLFNWTWYMGMLRGVDEHELITSLEPWVMTPRVLTQTSYPGAGLIPERADCEVYETHDISSQIHH